MCQLCWPAHLKWGECGASSHHHKVLLFVFCSQLKAFLRSSFCPERASVWDICWNNTRRLRGNERFHATLRLPLQQQKAFLRSCLTFHANMQPSRSLFPAGGENEVRLFHIQIQGSPLFGSPRCEPLVPAHKGKKLFTVFHVLDVKTNFCTAAIIPSFPESPQDVGKSQTFSVC